jgi:hypothetical protein
LSFRFVFLDKAIFQSKGFNHASCTVTKIRRTDIYLSPASILPVSKVLDCVDVKGGKSAILRESKKKKKGKKR